MSVSSACVAPLLALNESLRRAVRAQLGWLFAGGRWLHALLGAAGTLELSKYFYLSVYAF